MRKALDQLYLISGVFAALFLVAICLTVTLQVSFNILDNLLLRMGWPMANLIIPSYAELTGYFLVAASFLALAYTLRAGGHIRVSLFIRLLNRPIRKGTELFCVLSGLALVSFFTWHIVHRIYNAWKWNDLSSGILVIPIWIPQLPMAIGSLILSIALLDELISILRGNEPTYARGDQGEMALTMQDDKETS